MNTIQKMLLSSGMLEIKLPVKHDVFPENEILINADCWCDIGAHKVCEWMLVRMMADASCCEDCYDNFN